MIKTALQTHGYWHFLEAWHTCLSRVELETITFSQSLFANDSKGRSLWSKSDFGERRFFWRMVSSRVKMRHSASSGDLVRKGRRSAEAGGRAERADGMAKVAVRPERSSSGFSNLPLKDGLGVGEKTLFWEETFADVSKSVAASPFFFNSTRGFAMARLFNNSAASRKKTSSNGLGGCCVREICCGFPLHFTSSSYYERPLSPRFPRQQLAVCGTGDLFLGQRLRPAASAPSARGGRGGPLF